MEHGLCRSLSWQIVFGRSGGAKYLKSSLHSAAGLSDQVAQLPSAGGLRRTMGQQKVAHLGMKSILAGTMATCMTGAIAGLLSWPQGGWMNPPGMALAGRLPCYGKSDHWCRPSESQVRLGKYTLWKGSERQVGNNSEVV